MVIWAIICGRAPGKVDEAGGDACLPRRNEVAKGGKNDKRERQEWELAIIWRQGKGSMILSIAQKPMMWLWWTGRRPSRRSREDNSPSDLCTKMVLPLSSSQGRGAWIECPRKWSARRSPSVLGPQLETFGSGPAMKGVDEDVF